MNLPHAPVGSPYQAPRDCVLFGFTPEEKESIARAQQSSKMCWHCGRRYLSSKFPDACSLECADRRELCYRIERDDLIEGLRNVDPELARQALEPDPVPPVIGPPTRGTHSHVVRAVCCMCKTVLGPFKDRSTASRAMRQHKRVHRQVEDVRAMSIRTTLDYTRIATVAHAHLKKKNTAFGPIMGLQRGEGLSYQEALNAIYFDLWAIRKDNKKASPKGLSKEEAQIVLDALIAAGRWTKRGERIYFER